MNIDTLKEMLSKRPSNTDVRGILLNAVTGELIFVDLTEDNYKKVAPVLNRMFKGEK